MGPTGLEPTTLRLTAECSTIELSRNKDLMFSLSIISSKLHTVKYHSGKKNRKALKADALVSVPRSLVRFAPQTFRICMSAVPECKHSSPAVIHLPSPFSALFGKSLRPISNSQLRTLLHFHLCPIYLMFSKGS